MKRNFAACLFMISLSVAWASDVSDPASANAVATNSAPFEKLLHPLPALRGLVGSGEKVLITSNNQKNWDADFKVTVQKVSEERRSISISILITRDKLFADLASVDLYVGDAAFTQDRYNLMFHSELFVPVWDNTMLKSGEDTIIKQITIPLALARKGVIRLECMKKSSSYTLVRKIYGIDVASFIDKGEEPAKETESTLVPINQSTNINITL